MAGLTPLPPTVHHTSTRLTQREAHTFLSTYLERAENDPAYRPDSTLTERGPISSSIGAAQNLTLHHLKRILLGLEGKKVGGADFLGSQGVKRKVSSQEVDTTQPERPAEESRKQRHKTSTTITEQDGEQEVALTAEESDDWQDKDEYEHAQEEGLLDLTKDQTHPGGVDPADGEGLAQPLDEEEEQDMVDVRVGGTGEVVNPMADRGTQQRSKPVNKEDRKLKKKERRKAEQQQKQRALQSKG